MSISSVHARTCRKAQLLSLERKNALTDLSSFFAVSFFSVGLDE